MAAFRAVPTRQATLAAGICFSLAASTRALICGSLPTSFGFLSRWYSVSSVCVLPPPNGV